MIRLPRIPRGVLVRARLWLALAMPALSACDVLNPRFVDYVSGSFNVPVQPLGPTSRGPVVIAFRNDMVFDEQLLDYLVAQGMDPTLLDDPNLRPRVRIAFRITLANGNQATIEFNDGSSTILDPQFGDAANFPALIRTEQDNLVLQCDVARVELAALPSVFIPVEIQVIGINRPALGGANVRLNLEILPGTPGFQALRADDPVVEGTIPIPRNFDIRDLPAPADGPSCGSVVTFVMTGTVRVHFDINEFGALVPGWLITDRGVIAAHPGRFKIAVQVK